MRTRLMRNLCGLLSFSLCAGYHTANAACPAFIKKTAIEGAQSALPSGWFAYSKNDVNGIFWSPLKSFSETLIPGTSDAPSWRVEISSDGKWLLAGFDKTSGGELRMFKRDGSAMTVVITGAPVDRPVSGFVRNGPKGTEIFYGIKGTGIRGMAVNLTGAAPAFGATRLIIDCLFGSEQWPGIGISGSHAAANNGDDCMGDWTIIKSRLLQMVTIPNSGNGTANVINNRWPYTVPEAADYGCNMALSWDGTLVCHNPGMGWADAGDTCFPIWDGGAGSFDHKGPVVVPFMESNQPVMSFHDYYYQKTVSVNWTLNRFRIGSCDESGFEHWYFGNTNAYLMSRRANIPSASNLQEWGAWMVELKTNTWTRVTPANVQAKWPAFQLDSGQAIVEEGAPRAQGSHAVDVRVSVRGDQRIEISFAGATAPQNAVISIHDLHGALLRRIDAVDRRPVIVIDACDACGNRLAQGRYFLSVKVGAIAAVKTVAIFK